jgi:4-amino-4-deoxy-L-arabinose transferase-like glycosyltransferase
MKYFPVLIIVLIGFFLRVLWLDQFPEGVTADEIQQGYMAYSILHTGKDEWGDFLPLNPTSLGEYKPILYSALIIPFEAILGLNIYAVRLPSALAGGATVLVIVYLVSILFKSFKIGLLSGAILAISFWHIIFSRIGWESNVGLFFFCLGLLLFLKSFKNRKMILFSSLSFSLTLISYNSFKFFTPIFILGLIMLKHKELAGFERKWLALSFLIFTIFISILAYGWIFSGGSRRAEDAAIYNQENLERLRRQQYVDPLPQPLNRLVNSKYSYLSSQFIQNYFGYFSPTFLISPHRSDASLFNLNGSWLISFWEFSFLILGIYFLFAKNLPNKKIFILWILTAPIPASLTRDYNQVVRVEPLLITLPIISGLGAWGFWGLIEKSKYRNIILSLLILIIGWTTITRADYFLAHHFRSPLGGLKFGYQDAIFYTEENKDKYDKIIFTKYHSNPQIFTAFYSEMEPQVFQKNSQNWKHFEKQFKFVDMIDMKLEKYYFQNIDFSRELNEKNALIVAVERELPPNIPILKVINDPSGRNVFIITDTNILQK